MSYDSVYVSDIGYTLGYYEELNPLRAKFIMTLNGFKTPKVETYCELGFGQGLSINFHATNPTINFFGNDFNKKHVNFASQFSKILSSNCKLSSQTFAEFCVDTELPDFDFISLHGIWSWVDQNNRKIITDFIGQKLKVGGILYLSYNSQPGWLDAMPLRSIMSEYARLCLPDSLDTASKVERSKAFLRDFISTDPGFMKARPQTEKRADFILEQKAEYLAHEYFNGSWQPMLFSEVASQLKMADVDYICSSDIVSDLDIINSTESQIEFRSKVEDPSMREVIKDFSHNQSFRKDLWMKGPLQLTETERRTELGNYHVILNKSAQDFDFSIEGKMTNGKLNQAVYEPLLNYLAENIYCKIDDIRSTLVDENKALSEDQLYEAIRVLLAKRYISPAYDSDTASSAVEQCKKFNKLIVEQYLFNNTINFLVSPVVGGGVQVSNIGLMFIRANFNGITDIHDVVSFAWGLLSGSGERILKDGKPITEKEECTAELEEAYTVFLKDQLQHYKALKIIDQ